MIELHRLSDSEFLKLVAVHGENFRAINTLLAEHAHIGRMLQQEARRRQRLTAAIPGAVAKRS